MPATLAEQLPRRRCGYSRFIKTSVGTKVAEGKEVKLFDGNGNLIFRKTARNFNQPMATAADICIAEVEEDDRRRAL